MFSVIAQSIYVASYTQVKHSLETADFSIEPQVAHIGIGDFHHAQECFRQREIAGLSVIPKIRRELEEGG